MNLGSSNQQRAQGSQNAGKAQHHELIMQNNALRQELEALKAVNVDLDRKLNSANQQCVEQRITVQSLEASLDSALKSLSLAKEQAEAYQPGSNQALYAELQNQQDELRAKEETISVLEEQLRLSEQEKTRLFNQLTAYKMGMASDPVMMSGSRVSNASVLIAGKEEANLHSKIRDLKDVLIERRIGSGDVTREDNTALEEQLRFLQEENQMLHIQYRDTSDQLSSLLREHDNLQQQLKIACETTTSPEELKTQIGALQAELFQKQRQLTETTQRFATKMQQSMAVMLPPERRSVLDTTLEQSEIFKTYRFYNDPSYSGKAEQRQLREAVLRQARQIQQLLKAKAQVDVALLRAQEDVARISEGDKDLQETNRAQAQQYKDMAFRVRQLEIQNEDLRRANTVLEETVRNKREQQPIPSPPSSIGRGIQTDLDSSWPATTSTTAQTDEIQQPHSPVASLVALREAASLSEKAEAISRKAAALDDENAALRAQLSYYRTEVRLMEEASLVLPQLDPVVPEPAAITTGVSGTDEMEFLERQVQTLQAKTAAQEDFIAELKGQVLSARAAAEDFEARVQEILTAKSSAEALSIEKNLLEQENAVLKKTFNEVVAGAEAKKQALQHQVAKLQAHLSELLAARARLVEQQKEEVNSLKAELHRMTAEITALQRSLQESEQAKTALEGLVKTHVQRRETALERETQTSISSEVCKKCAALQDQLARLQTVARLCEQLQAENARLHTELLELQQAAGQLQAQEAVEGPLACRALVDKRDLETELLEHQHRALEQTRARLEAAVAGLAAKDEVIAELREKLSQQHQAVSALQDKLNTDASLLEETQLELRNTALQAHIVGSFAHEDTAELYEYIRAQNANLETQKQTIRRQEETILALQRASNPSLPGDLLLSSIRPQAAWQEPQKIPVKLRPEPDSHSDEADQLGDMLLSTAPK